MILFNNRIPQLNITKAPSKGATTKKTREKYEISNIRKWIERWPINSR